MSNKIDPVELSKELISCESVTPDSEKALNNLQNKLENIGFKCQRLPFEDKNTPKVDNLYAKIGQGSPHLCFAGHLDVVPPGPLDKWTSPPFSPEIRNEMLYGRGASDMKCAIACFVSATESYLKSNQINGTISFLITGDEEGPSINGTRKMLPVLKEQGEKWDFCIVGEPTSVNQTGDMIKIGRRGSINFEIEITGKQGHVAYPHLADNPVSRLTSILSELNNHELDKGTEYFQPSNLEIVSINVNNNVDNVIPESAVARFNIRYNDIHNSKTLIKWVEGICSSVCEEGDSKFKISHRLTGESFLTKPGEFSDIIENSIKKLTGIDTDLSTTGGTSDARFIKDYCPVVELGLTNATAHKIDEHVPISDIYKLASIYESIIEKIFSDK